MATAVFLELNGVPIVEVLNEGVYKLVMEVAAHHQTVEEIAGRLRRLGRRRSRG